MDKIKLDGPVLLNLRLATTMLLGETAVKTNLGLDLGLWKDRFSLQMDFFYEKRKGILMQRQSVPTGAGFLAASVLWGNLGKSRK